MAEENKLSYDAWKEYLKADKDMNTRWKSLTSLWENVSEDLKNALEKMPKAEATKRRRELTAKNIFNIISTAKQKPNFRWQRKMIWNEEDERYEYVIQCLNPSSDYLFRKIKEERWVTNMHWESINKYLQPVTNKIWALKAALNVSVNPETSQNLSYESVKMCIPDDEKEVDPDYPKPQEWWRDPVKPGTESSWFWEEIEEKPNSTEDNSQPIFDEEGQGIIPFEEL